MNWHVLFSFFLLISSAYAKDIQIQNAWIKAAPPVSKMSAAFMEIKNSGQKKRYLVKAKADFAKNVEIHTNKKKDGIMQMRQLKELPISAGSTVTLKHGGHHIMFMGLKEKLQKGQTRELTLVFKNGEEVTVEMPVKSM